VFLLCAGAGAETFFTAVICLNPALVCLLRSACFLVVTVMGGDRVTAQKIPLPMPEQNQDRAWNFVSR